MGSNKRPRGSHKHRKPHPHDLMFLLGRESDEEYFVIAARHPLMAPMTLLWACLVEKDYASAQAQFEQCLAAAMLAPLADEAEIIYAVETAERGRLWHDKHIVNPQPEEGDDEQDEEVEAGVPARASIEFPDT